MVPLFYRAVLPISLAKNQHSYAFAVIPCHPSSHTLSCCLPMNRNTHVCLHIHPLRLKMNLRSSLCTLPTPHCYIKCKVSCIITRLLIDLSFCQVVIVNKSSPLLWMYEYNHLMPSSLHCRSLSDLTNEFNSKRLDSSKR